MKRLNIILITFIVMMLTAIPVLAVSTYYANITVSHTAATDYPMLGVTVTMDNDYLATNGYITASGLDTQMEYSGVGTPHMVVDDRTLFAMPVASGTVSYNTQYTTDNTPATNLHIVSGYGGYLTIPDNATIELGGDFLWEQNGYIDTTGGAGNYMAFKPGAFILDCDTANTVTGTIFTAAPAVDQSYVGSADASYTLANPIYYLGQTFTTGAADALLYSIRVYVVKVGAPTDVLTCYLAETVGGLPTTMIASGSLNGASIVSGAVNEFIMYPPPTLTNGTMYAWYLGRSVLDTVNYYQVNYDNTASAYAGGTVVSYDAGWSIPGGVTSDMYTWYEVIYQNPLDVSYTSAPNLASGEHDITVDANVGGSGDMRLIVDGTVRDTQALGGASMTDTTNAYQINRGDTCPYIEELNIYVTNAVLQSSYAPAAIVIGTTLPDTTGANDGTFTFGSNPAGLTVTLGSLIPFFTIETTGGEVVDPSMMGELTPPTDFAITDASVDTPGTEWDSLVTEFATLSGDNARIYWWALWGILLMVAFMGVTIMTRNLIFGGLAGVAVSIVFYSLSVIGLGMVAIIVIIVVGLGFLENRGTI